MNGYVASDQMSLKFLGRVLAESGNVSEASIRLDNNTVRVDPLNNYKKYRGGYDVRNKHYWSVSICVAIQDHIYLYHKVRCTVCKSLHVHVEREREREIMT